MSQKLGKGGWLVLTLILVIALGVTTSQAQTITCNNASLTFGSSAITTFDFNGGATVGSFLPTGASIPNNLNNGRGVLVLGNLVYYTELSGALGFGPTDFIRIAPFNGGAGGADIGTLPNPRPTDGIQDIAVFKGQLYVLTGYPLDAPEVFVLDAVTGAVISGPISISAPAAIDSDGFTVLANGNFLINSGDASCTYNQYNPATGALIPATTIVVPGGPSFCTGVESDGVSLFFQTNFDSFTQTDLSGNFIANQTVAANTCEDISLGTGVCFGAPKAIPGNPNCHGKCVSFLATTHGGFEQAVDDLGFATTKQLQNAIKAFCKE